MGRGTGKVSGAVHVEEGEEGDEGGDNVERVQDLKVAIPGNAEDPVGTMSQKGIDDHLGAVA